MSGMTVPDYVSIASIFIATIALYQSWRAEEKASRTAREANDLLKQQVQIQERLTQIEQSREQAKIKESLRAVLRASLVEMGRSNYRLIIENTGRGIARNLESTLDNIPLIKHPVIPKGEQEIKLIGPESEISYCMAICFGCTPPFELAITWDDDSGQEGQYSTTLTF